MTADRQINLSAEWLAPLQKEFDSDYMASLRNFLVEEKEAGKTVYPKGSNIFHALDATPLSSVKVVILGQDPYHGAGQAHGLSFSVLPGVRTPPSLVNIYKEMESDLGIVPARHGPLEHWAHQGVLLLNSVLTVEQGKAASHKNRGWERFTDAVIRAVSDEAPPCVFMLWGAYAQKKASSVDAKRHLIIKSAHPSPLAAQGDFRGSKPFSRANAFLESVGRDPVDWTLPPA